MNATQKTTNSMLPPGALRPDTISDEVLSNGRYVYPVRGPDGSACMLVYDPPRVTLALYHLTVERWFVITPTKLGVALLLLLEMGFPLDADLDIDVWNDAHDEARGAELEATLPVRS